MILVHSVCCLDLSSTCFCTNVETLLYRYTQVFEECCHHGFESEVRAGVEASHRVLGLDLR